MRAPLAPTTCWGCGGAARPYHRRRGLCEPCYAYRRYHGCVRPAALVAYVRPTHCTHCQRPLDASRHRGGLCDACYAYAYRHGGAARPLDRIRVNAWGACVRCQRPGPRRQGLCAPCRAADGPGPGWVALRGAWAPPAAHCTPGESYDQVAGCARCVYATDCRELSAGVGA